MILAYEECKQKAQCLPLSKRAQLIEHLIANLDELDNNEYEQLWINESHHRYNEYKQGNITSRPSDQVFEDAKLKLASLKKCTPDFLKRSNMKCWKQPVGRESNAIPPF